MGRTRLKGVEVAGIRMGVEVPTALEWGFSEGTLTLPSCQPLDLEVYLGVRVGRVRFPECDSIVYSAGFGTFEVGRRGDEWWIASHGWERFERVARFNADFSEGDVVVSARFAASGRSPLEYPLDELAVLHRVTRNRGLILRGCSLVRDGSALVVLGTDPAHSPGLERGWRRLPSQLGAGDRVVLRVDDDGVRVFGEVPTVGGFRSTSARLEAVHVVRSSASISASVSADRLTPDDGMAEVLSEVLAPVHAPDTAEALLVTANALVERVAVLRLGLPEPAQVTAFGWGQQQAGQAFHSPQL